MIGEKFMNKRGFKTLISVLMTLCMCLGLGTSFQIDVNAEPGGSVSFTAAWAQDGSDSINLTVTPSQDGQVHYLVSDAGSAVPTQEEIALSGAAGSCTGGQDNVIAVPTADRNAKDIHVYFQQTGEGQAFDITTLQLKGAEEDGSADTYSLSVGDYDPSFGTSAEGYTEAPEAKTLTLTNTGKSPLQISMADASYLNIYNVSVQQMSLAAGESGSMTIQPITGLAAGSYDMTIRLSVTSEGKTVLNPEISVQFSVAAAETAVDEETTAAVSTTDATVEAQPEETAETAETAVEEQAEETAAAESGSAETSGEALLTEAQSEETVAADSADSEAQAEETAAAESSDTETTVEAQSKEALSFDVNALESDPEVQLLDTVNVDYGVKWVDTSSIQLSVTSTKAGTAYYLVQDSGSTAPTQTEVTDSGNTIAVTANNESKTTVSASTNTEKNVYMVFVDSDDETYDMTTMTLPAY
jgi:hypothetical protein